MVSKKGIVLLSGGMDSCVTARYAQDKGYQLEAISIVYGQRHEVEVARAQQIAEVLGIPFHLFKVNLGDLVTSALMANSKMELPTNRTFEDMQANGVAPSYVPARNSILLSLAAGYADSVGAEAIFIGVHREDHVGYPDTRPSFISAMSKALQHGTVHGVRVEAPFVKLTKDWIVRVGVRLGAPLHLTHSCYQGKVPACGVCDTCKIRINAFKTAGYKDPIEYAVPVDWGKAIEIK